MMMSLGLFVFSVPTVAYQELERSIEARFADNNRFGIRAASQHLGPGEDTVTLTGDLFPAFTGGSVSLDRLMDMQDTGKAFLLVDGTGNVLGYWTIRRLRQGRSAFLKDGLAQRMNFTLTLHHEPDDTLNKANLTVEQLRAARIAGGAL